MPWTHLHVMPTGSIIPCCYFHMPTIDYGNVNDNNDINELMNHENMKNLRRKFINGQKHDECVKCYMAEDMGEESKRHLFTNKYLDNELRDVVTNTKDNGEIINPPIRYIDVRFGNICNLRCRMCGHHSSSAWYDETVKIENGHGREYGAKKYVHVDCYDLIKKILPDVETIYFAGGEPILYPEHVDILDKLIELNKLDVEIFYNTNLTTLSYKGHCIPDIWKHFDRVMVGASIDGIGSAVEYIRTGASWERIVENFNKVRTHTPHVKIFPTPTIGVLNIENVIEFSKFATLNNWYDMGVFTPNYIVSIDYYNPCIFPKWYKEELEIKYHTHIEWLVSQNTKSAINQIDGFHQIIKFLKNDGGISTDMHEDLLVQLWNTLWLHDKTAGLNWKKSLPSLWNFFIRHAEHSTKWDVIDGDARLVVDKYPK